MQHIYYLDNERQPDGYYLIHTASCPRCPAEGRKTYLGVFICCVDAVREARIHHPASKGCPYCCRL